MVVADFYISIVNLLIYMSHEMPGCIARHEPAKGSDAAAARNACIERVGLDAVDYCMFIDSDMAFPQSGLKTLLSRNKKVISGVNFKKHGNYEPTIYQRDAQNNVDIVREVEVDKLFTVEGTGGAFLLVHTDVLKKISKRHGSKRFEWTPGLSEDLTFCQRVREAGEEVWVDSSVFTDHYTMTPRGMEDYLRVKKEEQEKRKVVGESVITRKGKKFDPVKFRREMIRPSQDQDVEGPGVLYGDDETTGSPGVLNIQTVE